MKDINMILFYGNDILLDDKTLKNILNAKGVGFIGNGEETLMIHESEFTMTTDKTGLITLKAIGCNIDKPSIESIIATVGVGYEDYKYNENYITLDLNDGSVYITYGTLGIKKKLDNDLARLCVKNFTILNLENDAAAISYYMLTKNPKFIEYTVV